MPRIFLRKKVELLEKAQSNQNEKVKLLNEQIQKAEEIPQIQKVFVHGFWGVALDGLMIDQKIPKDGW